MNGFQSIIEYAAATKTGFRIRTARNLAKIDTQIYYPRCAEYPGLVMEV
jgi:hypothetical protein